MIYLRKPLCLFILFLSALTGAGQEKTSKPVKDDPKMEWFENARLGIFIHWGIYSVNGIPESWAFFNNYISYNDYMKQLEGFTADKYDPEQWAELIKESGAGYSVITTRHHDGVSLWDSKMGGINTRQHTPAKRDVLTPFVKALRKQDIKTGLYYSLPDWSYSDYDVFTRDKKRFDIKAEPERWKKFQKYFQGQLKELSGRYNPDLYWFDGDWEHSAEEWESADVRKMLQQYNKNVIINSRLNGHGDYSTPEQGVPVTKPSSRYWELCLTMNDSWGYSPHDRNYKTPNQVIRTFIDCISNGGNLLLDIGPKPDGTIPQEQVTILKELGRWNKKHAQAIFGTRAGIARDNFYGKTTLSADGKTMYLFVETAPAGDVQIKGLLTPVKSVKLVGNNKRLDFKTEKETGITRIDIQQQDLDSVATVISVQFDKPVEFSKTGSEASADYDQLLKNSGKNSEFEAANNLIQAVAGDLATGQNPVKGLLASLEGRSKKEEKTLKELQRWTMKHSEVVEGNMKGLPYGYYAGPSSLSADRQTLYLYVDGKPNGPIAIKGVKNKIQRIRIVGNGTLLPHQILNKQYWSEIPGMLYINIPEDQLDEQMTIIAVLLDKPIDLFTEEVKPIESN
ncbi:alpha-L-fucosidase [Flavihumibacter sp. R14]|nr:alpha-L-fucosidase [Flavihumibacter soli]